MPRLSFLGIRESAREITSQCARATKRGATHIVATMAEPVRAAIETRRARIVTGIILSIIGTLALILILIGVFAKGGFADSLRNGYKATTDFLKKPNHATVLSVITLIVYIAIGRELINKKKRSSLHDNHQLDLRMQRASFLQTMRRETDRRYAEGYSAGVDNGRAVALAQAAQRSLWGRLWNSLPAN